MSGRGGAGNINAANERIAADLEANQQLAEDANVQNAEDSPIAQALRQDKQPDAYAHTGRGGAGNYYSPADLSSKGEFSTAKQPTTEEKHVEAAAGAGVSRWKGRGGAGNFVQADNETIEGRDPTEQVRQQQTLESVSRDVEAQLERPEKAYLNRSRDMAR